MLDPLTLEQDGQTITVNGHDALLRLTAGTPDRMVHIESRRAPVVSPAWQAAPVDGTEGLSGDTRETAQTLQVTPLKLNPHKLIYATIILMTGLALYDEGQSPLKTGSYAEMIGVVVAPLFALAMAHGFSEALDLTIRTGHRLTGAERRHILAGNLEYLYVAIPPIILLGLLTILGWNANDAVGLVQVIGIGTLFFWGAFAATKAGLGFWRRVTFGVSYGVMGLIVLAVEMALTH
jgi:hypothetical protein